MTVSDHVDETVEQGECDNIQSGGVKLVLSEVGSILNKSS